MLQQNSGMRVQLIPGARMLWIVVTKLTAPASDEIERMCRLRIQRSWPLPGSCSVDSGTYAVQPAWAAPCRAKKLSRSTIPPSTNSQYDRAFSRGNAMSRAPIINGTRKLPNAAAIGTRTRKIIVVPWIVTASLYEFFVEEAFVRRQELRADQQREDAADGEEARASSRGRGSRFACGRRGHPRCDPPAAPVGAVGLDVFDGRHWLAARLRVALRVGDERIDLRAGPCLPDLAASRPGRSAAASRCPCGRRAAGCRRAEARRTGGRGDGTSRRRRVHSWRPSSGPLAFASRPSMNASYARAGRRGRGRPSARAGCRRALRSARRRCPRAP